MRQTHIGNVLKVRAIAGTHVVTLAWDLVDDEAEIKNRLLGFAIERTEFVDAEPVERYYLRGIKRFEHKDESSPPCAQLPTSEHPVQSFQWGDYTVKPGSQYRYKIVPVTGKPKMLDLNEEAAISVDISTETADGDSHDIYFNRGVAGSQAYARKFGKTRPDENDPKSEQMAWLSRGLYEGMLAYIACAAGEDAPRYKLRGMFYEFRYLPVARALGAASDAGADVDIRYEAQTYESKNEDVIAAANIARLCQPQKSRGGIRHNKFLVLIEDDVPIAVWTGSTNISAGGIFGHSNVGHIVWDRKIAGQYLEYWQRLADDDVTRARLVTANVEEQATPANPSALRPNETIVLFSPRDKAPSATLTWYGDLMDSAKKLLCMTFAFDMSPVFQSVLERPGDTLRYAVFDDPLSENVSTRIDEHKNNVIAAGAKLEDGDMENFLGEELTGFNKNRYIHDKFMLVDPLSDTPIVVTGSANFSNASQTTNDENMLVIKGDTRVADIYFGEFMRIFDHLYSRYIVRKLRDAGITGTGSGHLKETPQEWLNSQFHDERKILRRKNFVG